MPSRVTRRRFVAELSGAALLLSRPWRLVAQSSIATRPIPASGESLPVVGLGSSKAVMALPETGPDALRLVLRELIRHGGRVVDTSPRIEDIDAVFGRLLNEPDLREALFVAVKVNTTDRNEGVAQFRQTQRLFGRRPIDLVQIESLRGLDAHWPNLRAWKDAGEARYIGVTVSNDDGYERLEAFMKQEPLDFVHVNYSVVERRAEERLLPLASERRAAVLTNRPFMNGTYFSQIADRPLPEWAAEFDCESWAQFSLKYILANPAVTCALAETTRPEHMVDNVRAGLGRLPDEMQRRRMRELIDRI